MLEDRDELTGLRRAARAARRLSALPLLADAPFSQALPFLETRQHCLGVSAVSIGSRSSTSRCCPALSSVRGNATDSIIRTNTARDILVSP